MEDLQWRLQNGGSPSGVGAQLAILLIGTNDLDESVSQASLDCVPALKYACKAALVHEMCFFLQSCVGQNMCTHARSWICADAKPEIQGTSAPSRSLALINQFMQQSRPIECLPAASF